MKRFWTTAEAVSGDTGWRVELDGKPLLTPARAPLIVPSEPLGRAIADEWAKVKGRADPRAMPLSGLANAALDRVAPDPAGFAAGLARYAEGDLTCYRVQSPRGLAELQAQSWDRLLAWARRRFDVDFVTTCGIVHVPQPAATVDRLTHRVSALDPFRLAGLSPIVTIGGSLIAGLALLEGAISVEKAWQAVTIDERWQLEQWGADSEAQSALDARRREFFAAARFLELLD